MVAHQFRTNKPKIKILKIAAIKPQTFLRKNYWGLGFSLSRIGVLKVNPQKLEHLLHTFLDSACLNVDVFDGGGKRYIPREWFIAPISIIEQAINFVMNGEIIHYRYDPEKEIISVR